jgi:uncharacterized protein
MDQERQRQIASKGGKAAHIKGRAHEFTPDQAREAGRKGGQTVSQNRSHMARIGRKGGEAVSGDRVHMAEIGRKGGAAVSEDRHHMAEIGREGGQSVSGDRAHMAEIGREGGHRRQSQSQQNEESPESSPPDEIGGPSYTHSSSDNHALH